MSQPANRFYVFGDFRVDAAERVVLREGEPVPLTPKVFDILLLLLENSGHIVEKDRLMETIWPHTFVEEGNLTQSISVLRKVLGDGEKGHQYIQTIPRRGYRFAGHVHDFLDESDELIIEEHSRSRVVVEERENSIHPFTVAMAQEPAVTEVAATQVPVLVQRRVNLRAEHKTLFGGMVALLVVAAVAGFAWRYRLRSSQAVAAPFSFENYTWEKLSTNDNSAGGISPDGQFLVYLTHDGNGTWSLRQRRLASPETVMILPKIKSSVWGMALTHDSSFLYYILADEGRDTGVLYKVSVLGGTPRKILERVNGGPSLSPDDQHLAFIRYNFKPGVSALITANANDGSDERVLESSDAGPELYNPAWSPDGLHIVCMKADKRPEGSYWSLVDIPANGGPVVQITEPKKQHFWWDTWLPDGSGVLMIATDPVSARQQVYFISYPEGSIRRITNDLYSYAGISISSDGTRLVTNQIERQSGVWVASANDVNKATKIAGCCVDRVSWMSDGHLVYSSFTRGKWRLWLMDRDGSHQQQLSPDNVVDWSPSVARNGQYIVFLSTRSGSTEIWRTDTDGRNPRQLTNAGPDLGDPRITTDGRMVYFSQYKAGRWVLARVAIDGGEPEQVKNLPGDLWDLSPENERLAYSFFDEKLRRWRVAVDPLEGDDPVTYFELATRDVLLWTPDGQGLIYKDPDSKVWRQPLTDEKPQPFLNATPETIYWADWSRDGQHLVMVRGKEVMNIVMLKRLSY